jgi:hypothetical protein
MEDHAYIGELVAAIAYLTVGVRMLRLSLRTGESPERLLGVSYTLVGMSYVFYVIPTIFNVGSLWTPLTLAGRITFDVAIIPFALFTRTVFRRDATWAGWLVCGFTTLIAFGLVFSLLSGDAEGMTLSNPWFWFEWVGYTGPSAWVSVEAFLAHAGAKKRVRIGLSDRLVANRFLLWAFHGLFGVGACLSVIPMYSEYAATQTFAAWPDRLLGGLEVGAVVTLWLVFFPPSFYRRWFSDAASMTESVEG